MTKPNTIGAINAATMPNQAVVKFVPEVTKRYQRPNLSIIFLKAGEALELPEAEAKKLQEAGHGSIQGEKDGDSGQTNALAEQLTAMTKAQILAWAKEHKATPEQLDDLAALNKEKLVQAVLALELPEAG